MKVLHLTSGNLFGGIETVLIALSQQKQLCPEMTPHFGTCFRGRLSEMLESTDAPLYCLGNTRFSRPWTVWQARQRLKKLLAREKFDIVICHACWPIALFGPVVKTLGMPLVFWCHDTLKRQHWLEYLAKQTRPDLVISNSIFTAETVPQLYANIDCQVIYNPLAAPKPSTAEGLKIRETLNTDPSMSVIIQVSRLERWKGHELLLSALALLKEQPNWVCWIVGGAQRPKEVNYLNQLQAQTQQLQISDRVKFLGQRQDVPDLLAAANMMCQPNIAPEPFGMTFIEALYAGLPVITTAMGGGQEIVTPDCGRLVPPHNPQALAKTLHSIVESPMLQQRLGAEGKVRAKQLCEPQQQLYKLFQALERAICKPKKY
jgi:glycosyltransferase involved in cell wall biosynthesis